jgi:hypothetical protein
MLDFAREQFFVRPFALKINLIIDSFGDLKDILTNNKDINK